MQAGDAAHGSAPGCGRMIEQWITRSKSAEMKRAAPAALSREDASPSRLLTNATNARARAWLAVCQASAGRRQASGGPRVPGTQAPRVVSCRMEAAMAAAVGDLPVVHEAREAAPIFRLSRSVGQVAARRPWASHASNSKSALSPARPRMSSMCHRAPSTAARAFSRTRPGVVVGQRVF
jgi:hypothetical protein